MSVQFAGEMTVSEQNFCLRLRTLFQNAIDGSVGFRTALQEASFWFSILQSNGYKADAMADPAPWPRSNPQHEIEQDVVPTSEVERLFLEDAIGLIDFALRNGLNFFRVIGAVIHDVCNLVSRYDMNLESAYAAHFGPKVAGWATRNASPVGESNEEAG